MKKRYLVERHPDLLKGSKIPVNYHYAQLFTSIITDDEGLVISSAYEENFFKTIEVDDYQTQRYLPKRSIYSMFKFFVLAQ